MQTSRRTETYVGKKFTLCVPTIGLSELQERRLASYNGSECTLVGFLTRYHVFPDLYAQSLGVRPGVYKSLGRPLVRLEDGLICRVDMTWLSYDVEGELGDPNHPAHVSYHEAIRNVEFFRDTPLMLYNFGDTVLAFLPGNQNSQVVQIVDMIYTNEDVRVLVSTFTDEYKLISPSAVVAHYRHLRSDQEPIEDIDLPWDRVDQETLALREKIRPDLRYLDYENTESPDHVENFHIPT